MIKIQFKHLFPVTIYQAILMRVGELEMTLPSIFGLNHASKLR